MNTNLICSNCSQPNPTYSLNCNKCNSFLRARIPNIDLWETVWELLVNPTQTFIKIIQAEKKNFIVFLLTIWMFKATINYYIINNYLETDISIPFAIIKGGLFSALVIIILTFLLNASAKIINRPTRFKDTFAILIFSLTPILLAFSFLTPFHIALYGLYWYTVNPPPYIIKPIVSYFLYAIEGLFYLWVLLLLVLGTRIQFGADKYSSLLIGLLLFITLFCIQFLI